MKTVIRKRDVVIIAVIALAVVIGAFIGYIIGAGSFSGTYAKPETPVAAETPPGAAKAPGGTETGRESPGVAESAPAPVEDNADREKPVASDKDKDKNPQNEGAPPQGPEEAAESSGQFFISWQFFVYEKPDFQSRIFDSFLPHTVNIIEKREDGWALIETYCGSYWAYLKGNLYYADKWADLLSRPGDETAIEAIGPQLVEIVEQRDNWLHIHTPEGEGWIDRYAVRKTVRLDVPSYDQRALGYPLGCEMIALTMLMNYVIDIDADTLVAEMPRADNPYEGFRGDPASTSRGWTIFPPALAAMTEKYLGSYHDMSGCELPDLKEKLNANRPVMVWVNGLGWSVHALCLTGYDRTGFYYNDPWTGKKDTFIDFEEFYSIWNKPIYDSVLDISYDPRIALSYY